MKFAGASLTFQEPQEPESRCSYNNNHPAKMLGDLLCEECEDNQKDFKRMCFFLNFLNLWNKCSIQSIPRGRSSGAIDGWSGRAGYTHMIPV